jgi:hypothetical protein
LLLLLISRCALAAAGKDASFIIVDKAEGVAPIVDGDITGARKEAEQKAYRDALRQAIGERVYGNRESVEIMEDSVVYAQVRDKIFRQANGIVKRFKITDEKIEKIVDSGTGAIHSFIRITASCKVGTLAIDGVLGPAVIDAMGNPRVLILVDEHIAGKKSSVSAAERAIFSVFEKAGYLILNSSGPVNAKKSGAEVLLLGKAETSHVLREKRDGVSIFLVTARVHLQAFVGETEHLIGSKTVETSLESTRPTGVGAGKSLTKAASQASKEMIHKIAYALAFNSQNGSPGVAVNIEIGGVSFSEAEIIIKALQKLVGRSGGVYERAYGNNVLEADVVTDITAKNIASFLSGQGIEIESFTQHTVRGKGSVR